MKTLQDTLNTYRNFYAENLDCCDGNDINLTASFVIPVFNSAASIEYVVAAIVDQRRADLINEIVLVNDGSTDDSLSIVKGLKAAVSSIDIIVIDNKTRHYSAFSRNRGIERCTGDLVFFIDSDIIVPDDYFIQHAWRHQNQGPCVTFSLRKNINTPEKAIFPAYDAEGDFRQVVLRENPLQGKPFKFCSTHNLAEMCLTCAVSYRRSDLERVQGCPENFVGWGYNDTAMATKVIALNRPVIPVLNTTVFHLEHAPRSGNSSRKWAEFYQNQKRYQKMLELPVIDTSRSRIEALEL